jgi:serine/threonine-protein kinase
MGKIYEAIQQPLGRRIALKVMDLGFAEDLDPDFQKRFFLEASTCAKLSHPNTIRVFDYGNSGDESDTYFIAMEFVEGHTLLRLIEDEAPLSPLRVIHIGRQICASLREAHEQGVIHRDLKPSNVLLTSHAEQADFVKVLDFGLVKLMREDAEEMTKSGLFLGSPNYMSPEQIRADHIDQRSDVYSLGVLLYMGLTATSPFKRESSVKVLLAQLEDPPEPFSEILPDGLVPKSLEWVVMTCLQKDPNRRFGSVAQVSRALLACSTELRGMVAPLQLSVLNGEVVLPPEAAALIDHSSHPMGPTAGELGIVRAQSAGFATGERSLAGPTPHASSSAPEMLGTEPSASAVRRRSRKKRQRVHKELRLFMACFVFLLLLGTTLFVLKHLESSEEPQLGQSDVIIEDLPSLPATQESDPQADTASPESPQNSATQATQDSIPDSTSPSKRPSKLRRTKRDRPTPSRRETRGTPERRQSPAAEATEQDKRMSPEREGNSTNSPTGTQSDVGSKSENRTENRGSEAPQSEERSPTKKKGDLRDPWGD